MADFTIDGSPENGKRAAESSLMKLASVYHTYILQRADHKDPIEHTVVAMAELVKAGKVKPLGLSEVSSNTLRRVHVLHLMPFTLDIEDPKINLLTTCHELGVKVVAYSPLGHGLLTGQFKSPDDFDESDFRKHIERYNVQNFPNILKLADGLKSRKR
ncbi:aldo-keto reductase yakc [Mycena rebaudengoi]|nr:aldo-keto reductase yakc [Mycena rebaudengoi]